MQSHKLGTIGEYNGIYTDLMTLPLSTRFYVCNGGYYAYVVVEEQEHYLIIPDAPADYQKHLITDTNRYTLEISWDSDPPILCRCECCNKPITSYHYIFMPEEKPYCSKECFISRQVDISTFTQTLKDSLNGRCRCDCCGHYIILGMPIYQIKDYDYLYCSYACLTDKHVAQGEPKIDPDDEDNIPF